MLTKILFLLVNPTTKHKERTRLLDQELSRGSNKGVKENLPNCFVGTEQNEKFRFYATIHCQESQAHTMWQLSKLHETERGRCHMQCFQAIPQPTPPTKSNFVKRLKSSQMTPLGEATSDKESLQMHCMSWDCCLYWSQSTDMSLFQLLVPEVQLPHWTNMLLKLFVVKNQAERHRDGYPCYPCYPLLHLASWLWSLPLRKMTSPSRVQPVA